MKQDYSSLSSRQSVLFEKWRKLKSRIQHRIDNGSFYELSRLKRTQLLKRLRRYSQQLQRLGISLKRLAIGGTLAVSLALAAPAQGQTLVEQTGADNPFDMVDVGDEAKLAFVDIDGDGDQDVFIGEAYGTIKYFENTGTNTNPAFMEQTGASNPLDGVNVGGYAAPALADIDNDGDLDAFIGEAYGTVKYYENTGDSTTPMFMEQAGANPLGAVNVVSEAKPTFADIDGDGDLDAFIGEAYGTIKYYENTGTGSSAEFTEQTGASNPLDGVNVGYYPAPDLADIDGDGDLDAFIGENGGTIKYYENTGDSTNPAFTEQTGADNPLDGVSGGSYVGPGIVDIDDDGDLDAFIGNGDGTISYYKNTLLSSTASLASQEQVGDLFPNPTKAGMVNLDYTAVRSEALVVRIVDATGKLVVSQISSVVEGANTLELDASGLSQGIYFVEIGEAAAKVQRKLVIQ